MLVCFTANHRNTRFDILEALATAHSATAEALVQQTPGVSGAVVLSTCNRFEAYLDVPESQAIDLVFRTAIETLSNSTGIDSAELESSIGTLRGADVVPHLFGVSSGLRSVVIGEDEIAGQVRRSLEHARAVGTATPALERLFQTASRTSKSVKTRTAIGRADRSLVRLALELAASRITDWSATRVLLIGTGQYAATTVAALKDRGVSDIVVYSPSGRAEPFATRLALTPAFELTAAITDSDIVISCTSRDHPVVSAAHVLPGRRRLIVDLGLPRNVAAEVADIAGIELLDLETIRLHAPLEELNATREAHAVVDDAVATYSAAEAERRAAGAVVALRGHVLAMLEQELDRSRRRGTWSTQSEADLRHFAGVLLHGPSARARDLARVGRDDEFADGLQALFGIELPEADTAEAVEDDLLA